MAAEISWLRERHDLHGFSFFDDSFAVGRRRVRELCDAITGIGAPVWWTCTAHPSHLDREVLADMKRAGCAGVDIGMESADPGMLLRIGKGVTVERVLDVLGWARDLGIHTVVNLMFGWPDETDAELAATIGFLDRAASLAGGFNARGVVVPYPGTALYDQLTTSASGFTEAGGCASRRSNTPHSRPAGTRPRSAARTPTIRRSIGTSSTIRRIASPRSAPRSRRRPRSRWRLSSGAPSRPKSAYPRPALDDPAACRFSVERVAAARGSVLARAHEQRSRRQQAAPGQAAAARRREAGCRRRARGEEGCPGTETSGHAAPPALDERRLSFDEVKRFASQLDPETLVEMLNDGRATVRANAALALAAAGHAVAPLVLLLRDSEAVAAAAGAEAIARLGIAVRALVPQITKALDGTQPEVTEKVITSLSELVGTADDELIAALDVPYDLAMKSIVPACKKLGKAGIVFLIKAAQAAIAARSGSTRSAGSSGWARPTSRARWRS